jgi:hypothetical protein
MAVREAQFHSVEIGELTVGRLRVSELVVTDRLTTPESSAT